MLLYVRSQQQEKCDEAGRTANLLTEFSVGLRFLLKTSVLRTLAVLLFLTMLSAGLLSVLDIFFVTQNLHTPPSFYGFLDTSLGVGAITGAILASMYVQRIGVARTLWLSVTTLGLFVLMYARLTSFLPAIGLLFFAGIPFSALDVAAGPLLLYATPKHLVARISALFAPITTVATLLGSLVAGYLDVQFQHFHITLFALSFGPVDTIFTLAGLLLFAGGIYAMVSLRRSNVGKEDNILSQQQNYREGEA